MTEPTPPSTGGRSAFFYGTLMAPQVLHRVCHGNMSPENPIYTTHNLTTSPAILPNHRRHRVKGADYPAILPHAGSTVRGTYVTGLTDADIWRLDIFEGSEYERREVKVKVLKPTTTAATASNTASPTTTTAAEITETDLLSNGTDHSAETYIWISPATELEDAEWDFEEFRREKMQFWVGAEREDYAGRPSIIEVDEAVAAAEKERQSHQQDGTRGRGANGHISNALKEEQKKGFDAAV